MKKLLAGLAVVLLLLAAGAGLMFSKMPKKGPPRVQLSGGVLGVLCGFSYAWIVPSATGVVLIDAGLDEKAPDILAALRERGLGPEAVRAILITHGHGDHFGGCRAFPQARVFAHPDDEPFITGQKRRTGIVGGIFSAISARKKPPEKIEPLPATGSITIDGITFKIIGLPGHSPGSVAYLLGDMLFSGDALMGRGDGLMPPTEFTSTDPAQSRSIVKKLLGVPFTVIANGHTAPVFDGHAKLEKFLREQPPAGER